MTMYDCVGSSLPIIDKVKNSTNPNYLENSNNKGFKREKPDVKVKRKEEHLFMKRKYLSDYNMAEDCLTLNVYAPLVSTVILSFIIINVNCKLLVPMEIKERCMKP